LTEKKEEKTEAFIISEEIFLPIFLYGCVETITWKTPLQDWIYSVEERKEKKYGSVSRFIRRIFFISSENKVCRKTNWEGF